MPVYQWIHWQMVLFMYAIKDLTALNMTNIYFFPIVPKKEGTAVLYLILFRLSEHGCLKHIIMMQALQTLMKTRPQNKSKGFIF